MRRWVFNVLAGVSLLLCVATAIAWQYGRLPVRHFFSSGVNSIQSYRVELLHDEIYLESSTLPFQPVKRGDILCGTRYSPLIIYIDGKVVLTPSQVKASFAGFSMVGWQYSFPMGQRSGTGHGAYVEVPYWMLIVLFGFLPALWLGISWSKRWRFQPGLCFVCGYDLRATPERCPECGTEVGAKIAAGNSVPYDVTFRPS